MFFIIYVLFLSPSPSYFPAFLLLSFLVNLSQEFPFYIYFTYLIASSLLSWATSGCILNPSGHGTCLNLRNSSIFWFKIYLLSIKWSDVLERLLIFWNAEPKSDDWWYLLLVISEILIHQCNKCSCFPFRVVVRNFNDNLDGHI